MITTQICISIAALALQLTTWNNVIEDIVRVTGTSTNEALEALLQFLAVLPEEANDGRRVLLTVPRNSSATLDLHWL